MADQRDLRKQIDYHLGEVARLRNELNQEAAHDWRPRGFYTLYHIMAGVVLGGFGAATSLIWNIAGSALFIPEKPKLYLIQVYLTFGMGERALDPDTDLSFALFAGILLYLITGHLYGVPLQILLQGPLKMSGWLAKFIGASLFGLALWVVNFYLILSWLQPLLFDGNWILDLVPWYVGASTHLIYAWTFFAVSHWGRFDAERLFASWTAVPSEGATRPDQGGSTASRP